MLTLDSRSLHESRIENRDSIRDDYVSILDVRMFCLSLAVIFFQKSQKMKVCNKIMLLNYTKACIMNGFAPLIMSTCTHLKN